MHKILSCVSSVIKKFSFYILLSIIIAASIVVTACSKKDSDVHDDNVFEYFFEALAQKQYAEAYQFLSEKIAIDNGEFNSKKDSNAISELEFTERYESIFDLLGINNVSYKINNISEGTKKRTVDFSITYSTNLIGELNTDSTVELLLENNLWKIYWTPSVIFSDMTWGDTIVKTKLTAQRGDILADGEAVATNVDLVTVYSLLTDYNEDGDLTQKIIEKEKLRNSAIELLSTLTDWSELTDESKNDLIDELTNDLAEKKLEEYMNDYELFYSLCSEKVDYVFNSINAAIGMERDEFDKRMHYVYGKDASCTLIQFYPNEITSEQIQELSLITSIYVATKNYGSARYYPYDSTLSHIIGYMGSASTDDIKRLNEGRNESDGLYTSDSVVGKTGIERLYEKTLRGKDGYSYFIRSDDGQNKKTLYKQDKEDGLDVNLTINLKLQEYTEKLMELVIFGDEATGAVVVMNPKTGAVEALASYPSYDINKITQGEDDYYLSLLDDTRFPLINKAVDGSYSPGSTFKAFVAAAALDEGVVNENYIFNGVINNDYWTPTGYGKWIWPAIKRTRVINRTEPNNMTNAMLHSDNIYFADLALKLGEEKFTDYMEKLGIGSELPFELGSGKSQIKGKNTQMNYKLLADSGYGQGEVLTSPLQLATMFCAFANDGDIPVPYVVDGLYKVDGISIASVQQKEPSIWIENAISQNSVEKILPMLEGVMDSNKNGTGRSLKVTDYVIAGKTGTAEFDTGKNRAISWFVGFRMDVSSIEEERLVLVMLDVPYNDAYTSLKFHIARELLNSDKF